MVAWQLPKTMLQSSTYLARYHNLSKFVRQEQDKLALSWTELYEFDLLSEVVRKFALNFRLFRVVAISQQKLL
jgi:hypothetical protein